MDLTHTNSCLASQQVRGVKTFKFFRPYQKAKARRCRTCATCESVTTRRVDGLLFVSQSPKPRRKVEARKRKRCTFSLGLEIWSRTQTSPKRGAGPKHRQQTQSHRPATGSLICQLRDSPISLLYLVLRKSSAERFAERFIRTLKLPLQYFTFASL